MAKRSAGILLWRRDRDAVRVLLVHPGGPFWARKDDGAWSIPKGEFDDGEAALDVAKRELVEELGPAAEPLSRSSNRAFLPLGEIRQKGGKLVTAFALEGDFDVTNLASNSFELEWPPHETRARPVFASNVRKSGRPDLRSSRKRTFPEVDRAGWFTLDEARVKILVSQLGFVTRIAELVADP